MDSSSPFRYLKTCQIVKERWLHFDCRDFFFDRTGTTTVSGFSMCIPYTSQILIGLKTATLSVEERNAKISFPESILCCSVFIAAYSENNRLWWDLYRKKRYC